jgi:2,3-diketo-5-methylthiopentyl-1-phosphate enolase
MKMDTMTLPEHIGDDYLIATYYMNSDSEPDLYEWVKLVAADQSAGTWTHVEGETPEVVEKYGCKIVGVYTMSTENACLARIAFPIANFPNNTPMIMSTVAGNVLGQNGIRLVDIEFPKPVLEDLPGPLVGISGMREMLGVYDRPLIGAILKPCLGVEPEVSALGAQKAAAGGVDVIKDDELLSDPEYSPMTKRVSTVMKYLKDIGKDKSTLYCINITGENLFDRARRAIDAGANSIMVNYQALGWGATEDLTRALAREGIKIPIFGHCAGMGAYYKSKTTGIGTALGVGKMARLIGMDMALVYPDSGRFGISTNELVETHNACIAGMGSIKKSFATLAGGVHPGTVKYLMDLLGDDTMLMSGGGIYGHPQGATAGAKAIGQAIEAVKAGISIDNAAKAHEELDAAIKFWGKS